jgi:hypothetical protein
MDVDMDVSATDQQSNTRKAVAAPVEKRKASGHRQAAPRKRNALGHSSEVQDGGGGHAGDPGGCKKGKFSGEEDVLLKEAVETVGHNWKEVAKLVPGRTHVQVKIRYFKHLDPSMNKGAFSDAKDGLLDPSLEEGGSKKGSFSATEDILLKEAVQKLGHKWTEVAKLVPGRSYPQVRTRYLRHLDPSINQSKFSQEEDKKVIEAYQNMGPKWAKIAELLSGRTDDQVKCRYLNHLVLSIKKGEFSEEEDGLLMEAVERRGQKWSDIAAANELPGRTYDQIRNRYMNHLDPSIKKGEFSEEEDGLLMEAVERRGQKWSDIAAANELPGRTYLQIRNRVVCKCII